MSVANKKHCVFFFRGLRDVLDPCESMPFIGALTPQRYLGPFRLVYEFSGSSLEEESDSSFELSSVELDSSLAL